jgi:hypothetical protein
MPSMAFDSHKHDTLARVEDAAGHRTAEARIAHERGALKAFLASGAPDSPVAVETVGHWYWIVDAIEAAGCVPKLVVWSKNSCGLALIIFQQSPEPFTTLNGAFTR